MNTVRTTVTQKIYNTDSDLVDSRMYLISTDFTNDSGLKRLTIDSANKWISLDKSPVNTGSYFLLISDQRIDIRWTNVSGIDVTQENTYSVIIEGDITTNYSIRNNSGSTANIEYQILGSTLSEDVSSA